MGISNGIVDYAALNLLLLLFPTRVPAQLVIYNALSLLLANVNSYVWNTRWTFRGRVHHEAREKSMFVAQAFLNVGVALGVVWGASSLLFTSTGLPSIVAGDLSKILSSVVATTLSFLVLRYVVFRQQTS